MSVPGVNLQTAATFMACVGDIGRFRDPRKLVSYLGLDPRVRQSGEEPVRYGHTKARVVFDATAPASPSRSSRQRPLTTTRGTNTGRAPASLIRPMNPAYVGSVMTTSSP